MLRYGKYIYINIYIVYFKYYDETLSWLWDEAFLTWVWVDFSITFAEINEIVDIIWI